MTVKNPGWPLSQLVTFELRDLRADLEHALAGLPGPSTDRQLLQRRLAEVIREQASRDLPADTGQWPDQPQ